MGKYFLIGIVCTLGVLAAIVLVTIIIAFIKRVNDKMDSRKSKAKTVLGDRETYLKRQMFEELAYIKKYKKQLEQGEWPSEMDRKFEYDKPKSRELVCEITSDGLIFKRRKRFLRLKECFKNTQKKDDKAKEPKTGDANNKKDNDNNKQ